MNPLDAPLQEEQIEVPPYSTIFKYAVIGSVAAILLNVALLQLMLKATSTTGNMVLSFGGIFLLILIYLAVMIFGVKEYRDKHSQGFISLGKGILIAFGSTFLMGILANLFNVLYFLVLDPGYTERSVRNSYENMGLDHDITMDTFSEVSNMAILFSSFLQFALGCVVGIIMALIVSAVLKRDRPYIMPPPPPQQY